MHTDLKPVLLRTAQLELPASPIAPEMAFSGQYAAAQLEKLDNSPLFRGRTFPLAKEIAAYLGYAPDFVPPTYLTFARAHQRIPSRYGRGEGADHAAYASVLNRDVDNFHAYTLHANLLRFNGDRLHIDYIIGTLDNLRTIRGDGGPLFCFSAELLRSPEDLEFFERWRAVHGVSWPYSRAYDHRPHHVLRGAFRTHSMYEEEWRAKRERRRRAVVEYNRSV